MTDTKLLSGFMEFRQVLYFIAIAEDEHFGRASKRLRIAQPALSRQVKLLEAEIGTQLFVRTPRGVQLTEAGRVFLVNARRIRADMQQAIEAPRAAAAGNSGGLRLGFIEVTGWHGVVPDGIRRFRSRFPGVKLTLTALPTSEQLTLLRQDQIDAALAYNPPPDVDLIVTPLVRHSVMLAVPYDSPLAAREKVRLGELAEQHFIGFQRRVSPRYHDDLTAAFHSADFAPHYVAELNNETDMLAFVSAGAGVALINSCQRWRQPRSVRFLPVEDLKVQLQLSFIYRRRNCTPPVAHFLNALTEAGFSQSDVAIDEPST